MNHFETKTVPPKITPDCWTNQEFSELANRRGATTDQGMQAIARRIVALRKDAGITQVQLAEEIGVSQPVVSSLERGELRVHGELIVQLSKLFKVSADEILGIRTPRRKEDKMTPELQRLWKKFQQLRTLPDKDQRAVIRMVNSLSKNGA